MKIGKKTKVQKEITRQERNRKNNLRRMAVSGVVALVIFIALIVIQRSILNQEEKLTVYQVKQDIASGTRINEENIDTILQLKEVQLSLIPSDYITDSSMILGKFVNRNYKANDIITTDGLIDTESKYKDAIEKPTEVSFSVDNIGTADAGTIREGDYINIYGMRRQETTTYNAYGGSSTTTSNLYTVDEEYTFKHVYIVSTYDTSGNKRDTLDSDKETEETTSMMFKIIIDEDDVPLFNEMIMNCDLRLAKLIYDTDTDYQAYVEENNADAATASKITTQSDGMKYDANGNPVPYATENGVQYWTEDDYRQYAESVGIDLDAELAESDETEESTETETEESEEEETEAESETTEEESSAEESSTEEEYVEAP